MLAVSVTAAAGCCEMPQKQTLLLIIKNNHAMISYEQIKVAASKKDFMWQ